MQVACSWSNKVTVFVSETVLLVFLSSALHEKYIGIPFIPLASIAWWNVLVKQPLTKTLTFTVCFTRAALLVMV